MSIVDTDKIAASIRQRLGAASTPRPTITSKSVLPELLPFVDEAAKETGLDRNLIKAMIEHESAGGRNLRAQGSSAYGPMQLVAGTAADLGVNQYDNRDNILGGSRYLKQQIDRFGELPVALTAYFKGPQVAAQYGTAVTGTTGGNTAEAYYTDILNRKARLDNEFKQSLGAVLASSDIKEKIAAAKRAQKPAEATQDKGVLEAVPQTDVPVAPAVDAVRPELPQGMFDGGKSRGAGASGSFGEPEAPTFREARDRLHAQMMERGERIAGNIENWKSEGKKYPVDRLSEDHKTAYDYYQSQKGVAPATAFLSSFAKGFTLGVGTELTAAQKGAQEEHKAASVIGGTSGTIGSALLTGSVVRDAFMKVPAMAKLAAAGKATKAMTWGERAGRWAFDAATRGSTVAGTSLVRRRDDLLSGDSDRVADAIKDISTGIAVSAIGSGPETMLPKGLSQIPVQVATDIVVQGVGDALLKGKNILTKDYWESPDNVQEFLINVGTSIAFSLNDAVKPRGVKPVATAESVDRRVADVAQKMAGMQPRQPIDATDIAARMQAGQEPKGTPLPSADPATTKTVPDADMGPAEVKQPPPATPIADVPSVQTVTPPAPKASAAASPDTDRPQVVLWDLETGDVKNVYPKSAGARRHAAGLNVLSDAEKADVANNKIGMAFIDDDGSWRIQTSDTKAELAKQAVAAGAVADAAGKPIEITQRLSDAGRRVAEAKLPADADKIAADFATENLKTDEDIDAAIDAIQRLSATPKTIEPKVDPVPASKEARVGYLQKSADAAAERIKERHKGQRLYSGLPVDDAIDYAIIGANKVNSGLREFGAWAADMVKDFGETIKPHLKRLWLAARRHLHQVMTSEAGAVKLPFGGRGGAKRAIHQATGVAKDSESKVELSNLKAAFSKVQRFGKESYAAGKIDGREAALAKMYLYEASVEDQRSASLEYLKSKKIPKEDRARLLVRLMGVETPGQQKKFVAAVDAVEEKLLTRDAREAATNALNRAKDHKGLRPEYKRVISAITEAYDPKGISDQTAYRLLKRKALEGTEVWEQIPDKYKEQIKKLEKRSVSQLSVEESVDLAEVVGRLIAQNDLKQKFIIRGKDREYAKVREQAVENISKSAHGQKKPPSEGAIPQEAPRGLARRVIDYAFGLETENPELILERMEGLDIDAPTATLSKVVYGGIKEGRHDYILSREADSKAFADFMQKQGLTPGELKKMSHVVGNTNLSEGQQLKRVGETAQAVDLPSGRSVKVTPAQRIGLYNTLKNKHGVRAVLDKRKGAGVVFDSSMRHGKPTNDAIYLTDKDVDAIIGSMSDKERAIGDFMFEYVNTASNARLDKASVNINGVEITIPNYWPMWRVDTYKNFRKGALKPEDMNVYAMQSLEGSGHLKGRTPSARGTIVIEDAFEAFHNTVSLSAKYSAFAERLRQAKQMLHDVEPTARKYGFTRELAAVSKFIKEFEVSERGNLTEAEKDLRRIVGKLTAAGIGSGNPFVMTKQLLSLPGIATEGLGKYMGDAMSVVPGTQEAKRLRGVIEKHSPETNYRINQRAANAELGDAASIRELDDFLGTRVKGLEDVGTAGIGKFDEAAILRIFKAAEAKVKADRGLSGDELGVATAQLAEKVIRRTQPMFTIEDRSAVSRAASHSTWLKLGTMFTSATNKINTMYKRAAMKYQRSDKALKDKAELARSLAVVWGSMSAGAAAVDEVRDWLMGRRRTAQERVMRVIGSTLAAGYFTRPVVGAAEGLLETIAGKRRVGKGKFEWATQDVAESIANDAYMAVEDVVKAISKDRVLETGNMRRLLNGTTRALDVFSKMSIGISPLSIKRNYFDMPKKVIENVIRPEHHKKRDKLLRQADYTPYTSRTMTIDKVEYLLTEDAYNKVRRATEELVAASVSEINDDAFGKLSPKDKKIVMSSLYKDARRSAVDMLKDENGKFRPGFFVKK